jgi:hypothetical protein
MSPTTSVNIPSSIRSYDTFSKIFERVQASVKINWIKGAKHGLVCTGTLDNQISASVLGTVLEVRFRMVRSVRELWFGELQCFYGGQSELENTLVYFCNLGNVHPDKPENAGLMEESISEESADDFVDWYARRLVNSLLTSEAVSPACS